MNALAHAHPPALEALRSQLDALRTAARPAGPPCTTGIAPLDDAIGGGLPRGRITEITGPLGGGKTALLRQVAARVLRTGAWVAWIDARRTLAPAPFVGMGDRFVVVRPKDPARSAWTADCLLRSGLFALVVLDAPPPLARVPGVRLAQLARDRDAACVVLSDHAQPSHLHGTLRLRLTPARPPRKRRPGLGPAGITRDTVDATTGCAIHVEKGVGPTTRRAIEVECAIGVARRLCTDSEIPDRRGVADHPRLIEHTPHPTAPHNTPAHRGTAGARPAPTGNIPGSTTGRTTGNDTGNDTGSTSSAGSAVPSITPHSLTVRSTPPPRVTHRRGARRAATPRLGSHTVRAGP